MSKYVLHNQNPFGKIIGDCVIRSLSQALNIDYKKICEMMGKGYREGYGLTEDVQLNDLYAFYKKYRLIKAVKFDNLFFDWLYRNTEYKPKEKWDSLSDFTDNNNGKYIVLVRRSDVNMDRGDIEIAKDIFKMTFHVVFADGDRKEYYDNMRNDPGDMTIYGIFKVK